VDLGRGDASSWAQKTAPEADLNIWLEIWTPQLFEKAPANWLIPNLEWIWESRLNELERFDVIACKTGDAYSRLVNACPNLKGRGAFLERAWQHNRSAYWGNITYTGFCSEDHYDPTIERKLEFLHVCGEGQRNTDAVVKAWLEYDIRYPLTIVGWAGQQGKGTPYITHHIRLEGTDLWALMNRCLFHLIPSCYEGWGHVVHEAEWCEAVILTTDAEPMSEMQPISDLRLRPESIQRYNLAPWYIVGPKEINRAVRLAAKISIQTAFRSHAEIRRIGFISKISGLLKELENGRTGKASA
jgi:hypothetical protein